jgi:hypothetical protein
MRRAALIEEAAEHDQRGKLQEGGLPIAGQALQEGASGQIMPIADQGLPMRRQSLVLQPPADKTLRGHADDEKREQDDREGIVFDRVDQPSLPELLFTVHDRSPKRPFLGRRLLGDPPDAVIC